MLAVNRPAKDIRASLDYNEQKVVNQQALLLDAHNFWQEKEALTMREKLHRFNDLTVLNERSKKHSIHISVNFHPDDRISDRQMTRIGTRFMKAIGFGDQPWLLYRHVDAGHPHMHIVTTNIRMDGSRISNDLRSHRHLADVCQKIETEYHLVHAIGEKRVVQKPSASGLAPLIYGKTPTKTGIAGVLQYVLDRYSVTSLEAYNALLGLSHVRADRGSEQSVMYQNKGLYYRMIDAEGKKLGAPIKASAFDLPVTLKQLERKFVLDEARSQSALQSLRTHIDWTLATLPESHSLGTFTRHLLEWENTRVVIPALTQPNRRKAPASSSPSCSSPASASLTPTSPSSISPDNGHGFVYIDFISKTAVRDADLGTRYTAAAILERLGLENALRSLAAEQKLKFRRPDDEALLHDPRSDPAQKRNLIFQLSAQHDKIIETRLEEQLALEQRQHLRLGL